MFQQCVCTRCLLHVYISPPLGLGSSSRTMCAVFFFFFFSGPDSNLKGPAGAFAQLIGPDPHLCPCGFWWLFLVGGFSPLPRSLPCSYVCVCVRVVPCDQRGKGGIDKVPK